MIPPVGPEAQPGIQSAAALLRSGLRRRHVEATLVRELGLTHEEARAVVTEALAALATIA
jgi:hypothetical protein